MFLTLFINNNIFKLLNEFNNFKNRDDKHFLYQLIWIKVIPKFLSVTNYTVHLDENGPVWPTIRAEFLGTRVEYLKTAETASKRKQN